MRHRPWRVKHETCDNDAIRSLGFEVPQTLNFGPRTLGGPASLAQVSYGGVLLLSRSTELVSGRRAGHRRSAVAIWFPRSLLGREFVFWFSSRRRH